MSYQAETANFSRLVVNGAVAKTALAAQLLLARLHFVGTVRIPTGHKNAGLKCCDKDRINSCLY